jgi:uncharacterized lipoprotein YddW (UPF0748 family)
VPIERALWITRWDYRTAEDVRLAIDRAAAADIDAVFFQVRGNATVFYPSALEPWAEEFDFRDPGFDPLAIACARADERGIALHAWVNALPGWRGREPPAEPRQLWRAHPDWFLVDDRGERQALRDDYVSLNPCRPDVRAHIAAVCAEIAAYPVAGIHLDYIRSLSDMEEPGRDSPRDPMTLARFDAERRATPEEDPRAWDEWRREQVTRLVGEIRAAVLEVRPAALLTAAVYPTPRIALERVRQDWGKWLRDGLIDAAVPMVYDADDLRFEARARECLAAAAGRPVLIGIGVHKHPDPAQTVRQVRLARRLGARGVSFFGYSSFHAAGPAGGEGATDELRSARRRALTGE